MKRIAVLIPDADVEYPVACCLALSGRAIVHGLSLRRAPLLKHSRFFASFEEGKGEFAVSAWLKRIGEIATERKIDVVLPIADFAIRALSERRHVLSWGTKLPLLPEPQTFDIATNKARLAEFMVGHRIPYPPTVVVTSGLGGHEQLATLKFPILAKPPLSTGGIGIRHFDTPEPLIAFLAQQPVGEQWVVQTFIDGPDLGVNVLCQDGRIIAATVQHAIKASPKPFASATGIEFRDDPAAMNVVRRLVGELGWSGVANIDMRFDRPDKDPQVLEINGRYWFSLLGSLNAGVNFPLLVCEMCLGGITANRQPHVARYFSGKEAALLSLLGGGRSRIQPHETNWRYVDPRLTAVRLAQSAAAALRRQFSRVSPSATKALRDS